MLQTGPSPAGGPTELRRDPRVDRTTAKVLAAARRLLETEGLQAVTFARLSRETGASRSTLDRHWASPTEVISDAWAQVAPVIAIPHSDDLEADLAGHLRRVRDAVESPLMVRSLPALLAAAQDNPVLARLHTDYVASRRRPLVDRLVAARDAGRLGPDTDVELVVDLLSGPLFYRVLLRRAPTSDAEIESLVQSALAAPRAPSETWRR